MRRWWRTWLRWGRNRWQTVHWYVTKWFFLWYRLLAYLGWLFRRWWGTRSVWDLVGALPAMLLCGAVVVVGCVIAVDRSADLRTAYQRVGGDALRSKNYATARLAYERLTLLDDDRPEHRYALAVSLRGLGEDQRARAIMTSLAPLGQPIYYGPADFWLGQSLLAQPVISPSELEAAEAHLLRAVASGTRLVDAHSLLGQMYLKTGRPEHAEKHLLVGSEKYPELALLLSGYYLSKGKKDAERTWSERCARVFRTQLERDAANDTARIHLAEALILLGDHPQAIEILRQGLLRTGARFYRARLADTYAMWLDAIQEDPRSGLDRRLPLIAEGLRYDPNNLKLVKLLAAATKLDGSEADTARASIEGMLAQGTAPGSLHLILGLAAFRKGQLEAAQLHLDRAWKTEPQMAVLANNVAVVLAESDSQELDRALLIINAVVKRQPKEPSYLMTRGQILARMGKWEEALPDLKACAAAYPATREVHRALAEIYAKLNRQDLAAEHRRLAETGGKP